MTASLLRQDAIAVIKAALAGTRTDRLVNVLEAAFVGEESKSAPQTSDPLGEEEENEDKALEALLTEHSQEGASTSTLSKTLKCKMPPPSEVKIK